MSVTALGWMERELRRERVVGHRLEAAVGVGAMVVCLSLAGAYARFYGPWSPVPITLQTFFVLVAGAGLGPVLGTVSLSAYVALGALGLPVFAGGWLGYTTGYLAGFVVAGALVGTIVRSVPRPSTARIAIAMTLGTLVVYALGAAWLGVHFGLHPWLAVHQGILPFVVGDALKLIAAVAFCRAYRERLVQLFP